MTLNPFLILPHNCQQKMTFFQKVPFPRRSFSPLCAASCFVVLYTCLDGSTNTLRSNVSLLLSGTPCRLSSSPSSSIANCWPLRCWSQNSSHISLFMTSMPSKEIRSFFFPSLLFLKNSVTWETELRPRSGYSTLGKKQQLINKV